MIVVLDASAGIELVLSRPQAKKFHSFIMQAKKVLSSDLYKIEVTNVLWKYVKGGFLSQEQAHEALLLAQDLIDEFVDISENNEESLYESIRLNHSSYDTLYFTLARRTGAKLLTLDKKLLKLTQDNNYQRKTKSKKEI